MIKYLISSVNEVRLEDMHDVEAFHEELQQKAKGMGCTLANFSWAEKEDKKLEITYYQVKYKFTFGTLKTPEAYLNDIDYQISPAYNVEEF